MAGALFGYSIESQLPLTRLLDAPAPRGTLSVTRADGELLSLEGDLVGWQELFDPVEWRVALARTEAGLLADCSRTGTFLVEAPAHRIRAAPLHTGPGWQHIMVASAIPLLLAELGDLVLHGSAVVTDAGVVAFCGPAGRGKSTLAYHLATSERPLLAEDGLALTAIDDGAGWLAWPGPQGVRLFVDGADGKRVQYLDAAAQTGDPAPLAAAVVLGERRDGPLTVERLAPTDAVQALMANATFVRGEGMRRAFTAIARVAERVPVFDAQLPDDLAAIRPAGERLLERVAAA